MSSSETTTLALLISPLSGQCIVKHVNVRLDDKVGTLYQEVRRVTGKVVTGLVSPSPSNTRLLPWRTIGSTELRDQDVLTAILSHSIYIYSTAKAFAALMGDGSVITWGQVDKGGDNSASQALLREKVNQIFSTAGAFAALRDDALVVTWGDENCAGDSHRVQEQLSGDVEQIFSTHHAFAACKSDGSVVT